MAQLRELLVELNLHDVATYIQSGNALFCHENLDEAQLIKDLQRLMESKLGWSVPAFIFNVDEWRQIIANNPFAERDIKSLHVTLLEKVAQDTVLPKTNNDDYKISGRAVYIYAPDGYRNTKLNNTVTQKKLKMNGTTRNWRTMKRLLELVLL